MTICPHGIECEVINTTQHFHGHGDIVTGQQLWHNEEERCMTFDQWLAKIDRMLTGHMGLTHRDIADRPYRDMYDDEVSPSEVVSDIVAEGIDAL